jgi:hypothetical protein
VDEEFQSLLKGIEALTLKAELEGKLNEKMLRQPGCA